MHETEEDLRELQALLDRSHARAGPHLRSIFSEERRILPGEIPALLPAVQVLALATHAALRAYPNETYPGWDDADWAAGAPYARIDPSAMFTLRSAA